MAELKTTDPAELWRQLVAQWEKDLNHTLNAAMGTEEFSRRMNEAQAAKLRMQQATGELISKTLNKLNLPSKEEVATLSRRLLSIEERLNGIEGMLRLIAEAQGVTALARPAPRPRTRKPPAAKAAQ